MATKPSKTVITPEPEITVHPDIALIDAYTAAKATIQQFETRVSQVAAVERAKSSQYTDEQIQAAKAKFNSWLTRKYQGRAMRAIHEAVDLDVFDPYPKANIDDVHPDMLAIAQHRITGLISGPSVQALNDAICKYIVETTEEDGALVFGEWDIKEITNLYHPPAPTIGIKTAPKVAKAVTEGEDTGNRSAVAKWPGTNITFKVSFNINTKKYSFRGQTLKYLLEELAAAGHHVTKEEAETWRDTNGPSLSFS